MKLLLKSLSVTLILLPLMAKTISPDEREQLVKHLEMSREVFLTNVNGLSAKQLNHRPSPDSWTILECAEHITVSEDYMYKMFQEKFLTLQPRADVTSATPDAQLLEYGYNRETQKQKASDDLKPTGRWKSLDEIIMQFLTSREQTLTLARKTKEDLRGRYLEDFKMDGYQFLLALSAHCQRHAKQISDIKASAEFPK